MLCHGATRNSDPKPAGFAAQCPSTRISAANLLPPPPALSSSPVYHWLTNGKHLQQYAKKPLRQMQVAQATKRLYSWALMEISVVRLALASCRKLDRGKNTKKETCKRELEGSQGPVRLQAMFSFHQRPWQTCRLSILYVFVWNYWKKSHSNKYNCEP